MRIIVNNIFCYARIRFLMGCRASHGLSFRGNFVKSVFAKANCGKFEKTQQAAFLHAGCNLFLTRVSTRLSIFSNILGGGNLLKQRQSLVIHPALERDHIVHRIPEIHPLEIGEFRFVGQIQAENRIIGQET